MSTNQLRKRIGKIEQRLGIQNDGFITLEELCRMMWRQGNHKDLKRDWRLSHFFTQFEREDAERMREATGSPGRNHRR